MWENGDVKVTAPRPLRPNFNLSSLTGLWLENKVIRDNGGVWLQVRFVNLRGCYLFPLFSLFFLGVISSNKLRFDPFPQRSIAVRFLHADGINFHGYTQNAMVDDSPLVRGFWKLFRCIAIATIGGKIRKKRISLGGGLKCFFVFIPIWGRFPFWLIFFNHQLVTSIISFGKVQVFLRTCLCCW